MDDLVSYILKNIVKKPEDIEVFLDEDQNDHNLTLLVDSDPDDVAIIIGRKGKTINALRNIISIKGIQERKRVELKLKHEKPRENSFENRHESRPREEFEDKIPEIQTHSDSNSKRSAEETEDILGF